MRKSLLLAALLISAVSSARNAPERLLKSVNTAITENGTSVRIFSQDVRETVRLFVIADTHLFRSDAREDPYRQYSARMAKAYNRTRHFQTGEKTDPEECFVKTLALAKEKGADAVILLGDMVSYPTEAGVEWMLKTLKESGLQYYYISGNHDWHYEGMPGSDIAQREEWTAKRLMPLLDGHDPLIYDVDVKGVKLILLSNGTYQLLPEQLDRFRKMLRSGMPTLLMSHNPFFEPTSKTGTGSPLWNAANDRVYKIERREQWPEHGFNKATYDFWKTIVKAAAKHQILATFAGHIHRQTSSAVGAWHQYTVKDNASGGYLEVTVEPMPEL